ncbi:MAG: HAD hydrolase-like protein [Parasphingorhabdus sp.]|uniref:HAD family hydrolase n=1 Tax=Parasphingorhabdus sp. TaxID=2709688 RepID=UPI0032986133
MPSTYLSQYDCIFFDFDGVIVDSVDAKISAFGTLYDAFGPRVRQVVEDYQRKVPGETRYDKIPRFHRDLLGISLSQDEISDWCNKLSTIVLDQVVKSPLLPDVAQILALLLRQEIQAHIISGTPHDELQIIVERKGLNPFFKSARGAPEKKHNIARDIMTGYDLTPAQCLFVGDAMTDYDCANLCHIDFLDRAAEEMNPFPQGTQVVDRLGTFFLADKHQSMGAASLAVNS